MKNNILNFFRFVKIRERLVCENVEWINHFERLYNVAKTANVCNELLDYIEYTLNNSYYYSAMIYFEDCMNVRYLTEFLRLFKQNPKAACIIRYTNAEVEDLSALFPVIEKFVERGWISVEILEDLRNFPPYLNGYSKEFFAIVDENYIAKYGFKKVYYIYFNNCLDVLKAIDNIPCITNKNIFLKELLDSKQIKMLSDYIIQNQDNFNMEEYEICRYCHEFIGESFDARSNIINKLIKVVDEDTLRQLLPIIKNYFPDSCLSESEFSDKIFTLLFDFDFEDKKDKLLDILNNSNADLMIRILKHLEDLRYVNGLWLDDALRDLVLYDPDFYSLSCALVLNLIRK